MLMIPHLDSEIVWHKDLCQIQMGLLISKLSKTTFLYPLPEELQVRRPAYRVVPANTYESKLLHLEDRFILNLDDCFEQQTHKKDS